MKYNEKVERFAPKLGRKNLVNGLSCPPFVYMEDSDYGMWVHYVKYCENIARQKYRRCLNKADFCLLETAIFINNEERKNFYYRWHKRWLELAEKFKDKEA